MHPDQQDQEFPGTQNHPKKAKPRSDTKARAKDTPDADCLPARRSSTEVTKAMAQLSSILGGKPGRPGDMLRGIPPRPPRPPKAPEPPRPPKPPKPEWQRKSDARGAKANEDQDRTSRESMPGGSWIPGWACDVRDYRHGFGPQTWLLTRTLRPGRKCGPCQFALVLMSPSDMERGNSWVPSRVPSRF